jgi:hypothetical protein
MGGAVKLNERMEILYQEVRAENLDDAGDLSQKLTQLADSPLVEEEGCVFLGTLRRGAGEMKLADFSDRTAFECYVNHIHVEDYLENGSLVALIILGRGLALARQLRDRLATIDGHRHFRVIVTFHQAGCTVRFHTIRPDEEFTDKELSGLEEVAVAVLETA